MAAKPRLLPNASAKPRKQAAKPRRQYPEPVLKVPPRPARLRGPKPHAATNGRPTLYDQAFDDEVIELGKLGYSPVQMAAHFDITRQTLENWGSAHESFLAALHRARAHCQAQWEREGQKGLRAQIFNAQVWRTSMQARFREDYTERQELSGPNGGAIPIQTDGPSARELAKAMALTLAKGLKEAGEE